METNFYDEEHFGTGLDQDDLLGDLQSSLLDIFGEDYSQQDSTEYIDRSVIWDQDVERELNGDIAVIPMSDQINSFPRLTNSPPSADFQELFSDWQLLAAIEAASAEDMTIDLHLPNQSMEVDMLDWFPPASIATNVPDQTEAYSPLTSSSHNTSSTAEVTQVTSEPVSEIPYFDYSTTVNKVEPSFESKPKFKKKKPKRPIRKMGGKNLKLWKQVVKEDFDLDTSFNSEIKSTDELDRFYANFDIISYVNGDDDMLQTAETKLEQKFEPKLDQNTSFEKTEKKDSYMRKCDGCCEKNMPEPKEKEEEIVTVKEKMHVVKVERDKSKKVMPEELKKYLHKKFRRGVY